jgi:hypothetical protein
MRWLLALSLLAAGCGGARQHGGDPDLAMGGGEGPDLVTGGNCTGLHCQIADCPAGSDTIVTGRLFAPNGRDPVPGAQIYVPDQGLAEFPNSVSCDLCNDVDGAAASTRTAWDGTFTLPRVPAGASIPIVFQLGRFRRVKYMEVDPCIQQSPPADPNVQGVRLPHRDAEGDAGDSIPKIAVGTGDYDQIECVLSRMGIEKFDLYSDRLPGDPPPTIGTLDALLRDGNKLNGYNILVVNCTENEFQATVSDPAVKKNLNDFVSKGGRLYITDWAYDVIEQVPEFAPYVCFEPQSIGPIMCGGGPQTPTGADSTDAYSNSALVKDDDMAQWLTQFPNVIDNTRHVQVQYSFVIVNSVADAMIYPTKTWVEGPANQYGVRPMTVTFDYNMCGRVHYSTYNTEPNAVVPDNIRFPNCKPGFSPQERLLEYLVFEIATCIGPIG